jgi:hypothetical protein
MSFAALLGNLLWMRRGQVFRHSYSAALPGYLPKADPTQGKGQRTHPSSKLSGCYWLIHVEESIVKKPLGRKGFSGAAEQYLAIRSISGISEEIPKFNLRE